MVKSYQMYINGEFTSAIDGRTLAVYNPATEQVVSEVPRSGSADAQKAIDAAADAQEAWERLPAIERAKYLRLIANGIRERADEIARTISEEMGKTLALALVEVNFTADYMDYMAEWARRYEGEIIQSDRPNEHIFLYKKSHRRHHRYFAVELPFLLNRSQSCAGVGHREYHCD